MPSPDWHNVQVGRNRQARLSAGAPRAFNEALTAGAIHEFRLATQEGRDLRCIGRGTSLRPAIATAPGMGPSSRPSQQRKPNHAPFEED